MHAHSVTRPSSARARRHSVLSTAMPPAHRCVCVTCHWAYSCVITTPTKQVCHTPSGPCDTQTLCSGTSATCPATVLRAAGFVRYCVVCRACVCVLCARVRSRHAQVCRAVAGPCDVAETCSGMSVNVRSRVCVCVCVLLCVHCGDALFCMNHSVPPIPSSQHRCSAAPAVTCTRGGAVVLR
jgi:hypothetical protein